MRTLIIGGNSGIGEAIFQMEKRRSPAASSIWVPSIEELDVTDALSVQSYFAEAPAFNRIVYSAGVNQLMPLGWISDFNLAEVYSVNVLGFIRVLNAIVHNRGPNPPTATGAYEWQKVSVVAIVSDSATTAMRHSIAYASSKAALAHAIRCGARELAPWCRVNGVSPSIVADTPMTESVDAEVQRLRGWTEEQASNYERSLVPMGRRCTRDEVARVALGVLDGPEFMTGAIIPITGGK